MPVPNELTAEEEAEFAQHGIPSPGAGSEPLAEENTQQQQQQESQQTQEQQRQTFHRQDGRFASREEAEQGQARPGQPRQQPQQQQEDQQPQQQQEGQQPQQEGEQGQPQEQRMVPLPALHAERQKTQQLARQLQLAQTRMNALLNQQQGGGQQRQQMPDLSENPVEYIQALEQRLAQFEQTRQEETQYREVDNGIEADEAIFAQTAPDYPQASDYYVQSRAKELLQFYPPQEAQRLMLQEARQIAREAWNRGMSSAEVVYGLAQARGYNPNTPSQYDPPQNQQQGQQQQTQQQPAPQNQQQGQGMRVVESVQNAQQQSRSLSGGGSGSLNVEQLNAQALLNMTDEEFEAHLALGQKGANQRFASIG